MSAWIQSKRGFAWWALAGVCVILNACVYAPGRGPVTPATPAAPVAPETVVATVNGEAIHQGDVDAVVADWIRRDRESQRPPTDEQIKRVLPRMVHDAREFLIDKALVGQAIRREGIKVDEAQVDQSYNAMAADLRANGMSMEELQARMHATPEIVRGHLRERLAEDVYWEKHLGLKPPGDAEVRKVYEANKPSFTMPPAVRLREVRVAFPAGRQPTPAERAALHAKAEAMRARLLAGEPLATVARDAAGAQGARDEGSAAAQNAGDLGWVSERAPLPPSVIRAAFSQPAGQVGAVIEAPDGFHILVAGERRGAQLVPFDQVKAEIADQVLHEERTKRIPPEIAKLRREAKIELK